MVYFKDNNLNFQTIKKNYMINFPSEDRLQFFSRLHSVFTYRKKTKLIHENLKRFWPKAQLGSKV